MAEPSPTPEKVSQSSEVEAVAANAKVPAAPTKDPKKMSVQTMEDLKKVEPKVYKATLEGIARTIIGQLRRHQERLKKLMREGQRQARG